MLEADRSKRCRIVDLAVPIVRLMSQGQVSTFSKKVCKFLLLILTAVLSNLLVISTKQDKVLPGCENGCQQAVNKGTNVFPGLPHASSERGQVGTSSGSGGMLGKPSLAKVSELDFNFMEYNGTILIGILQELSGLPAEALPSP